MHRVVGLFVITALICVFVPSAQAAPTKQAKESKIQVKQVKMVVASPRALHFDPFALTKILIRYAVNPRSKMLSAALEGMTVPLTDGSDQRAARPVTPRFVAVTPPPTKEPPLPTTFQAP